VKSQYLYEEHIPDTDERGGNLLRKTVGGGRAGTMALLLFLLPLYSAQAFQTGSLVFASPDSAVSEEDTPSGQSFRNAWGLDVLISNDGFGLGTFYTREFTEDLYGFVTLSISEAKDDREVEFTDFFGNSFVPGKLNRFLVIPLTFGIQRRLFREDIVDTFRPYVNAGIGPAMIYSAPFTEITELPSGGLTFKQIEFFESLGQGQAHYTFGGYIGVGANFGSDRSNLFGVNFRYYFTYLLGDGIPALYDTETGKPAKNQSSFGGFFITLNVGMVY
jgi:hypothetical protein